MARLITEWAWLLPALKPPQRLVLLCMARAARDEDALCWESQATLCRRTGHDLKTVKAALAYLIKAGLIFDTGKRCGRTGSVIIYQIGGFSLAGLNDLQAQEKALTQERNGRVFERPLPENLDTPASPNTDQLSSEASPEKDYLDEEASPNSGSLPVDNFAEIAQNRATLPDEASPNSAPLNGEGSPNADHLVAEASPFFPVKLARFSHEASPKTDYRTLKESLLTQTDNKNARDANVSQTVTKAIPGSRVVKRTKAALERERLAARYAATRERNAAMVELDHSGELVQTDDKD